MVHKSKKYYDLVAYKVGRFHDAVNTTVHFFVLDNIFIDSAQPTTKKIFIEIAKNYKPEYCLLTHYHEDHAGNAYDLKKLFNTKIFSHNLSVSYLENGYKMLPYEKIIWGVPEKFSPDFIYSDKVEIGKYAFNVIHTPGHSVDSVSLLEINRGWLFTGDLFISAKPKYLRRDENIYTILESLKKLLNYDFDVMFCAHRGIVDEKPKELISKKIEYIEELIDKVKKLHEKGYRVKKIRNKLLGFEDITSFATNFDFNKLNIVKSILSD